MPILGIFWRGSIFNSMPLSFVPPLAWDSAISLLGLLCGFLGVNVIARNDIIHSFTSCLPIQIRYELLIHRRLGKLESLWSSEEAYDQALCFVTKNLSGPELPITSITSVRCKNSLCHRRGRPVRVYAAEMLTGKKFSYRKAIK